jgi:serralysin
MSTTILAVNHTDSSDADLPAVLPEATSLPESAEAFGVATPSTSVTSTGNNNIDGLLIGSKWSSNSVTFSFTDSINDYEAGYPNRTSHAASFQTLNATQRAAAQAWLGRGKASSFYNVSNLSFTELTGASDRDATIRMAMSNNPPTAFAYYPANTVQGGDAWFNRTSYNSPIIGTFAYHTFGHELGHALGLKHGHELGGVRNVAMNADRDSMEFSIMTYRSYVGDPLIGGYSNEAGGYAQSLMMYDIAAIQHIYGANFGYNSTNTTYKFDIATGQMKVNEEQQGQPFANRIFRTIWDGGGVDTYDFSNYSTNLSVDLAPGGWSNLDTSGGHFQQANLGDGKYARGHVFNALQYQGDARSLIENANGGSGNDVIRGNIANNVLNGNGGNDTIYGEAGNDTVDGGAGDDLIYLGDGDDYVNITSLGNDTFYGGNGNDFIYGYTGNEFYYGEAGNDTLKGSSGNDTIIGGAGADNLDGGIGIDTLSYVGSSAGVTVNLAANTASGGHATGDIIVAGSFENLTGSSFNDILTGSSGNNTITAGAGNDTVDGGAGDDLIYLGDGDDYVNITSLGNDTFYGGNGNDFIYGYTGNEFYYGEAGNDTLKGSSGNDTIIGGAGADNLDGGIGIDTLSYVGSSAGVIVNLAANTASGGDATGDIIVAGSFENLTGSSFNDILTGNSGNNTITAGAGNDTVDGGSGDDLIYLGDGDDYVNITSLGNDTFYGGNGNDFIYGYTGNESYYGEAGNDTLLGYSGNDNLSGGDGNDSLTGGAGLDTLTGGLGADSFKFNLLSEGIDIIKDFLWGQGDKIVISKAGFGATSTSQFSYNASTGGLFCDPTGLVGATQFATLQNLPSGFAVNLDILLVA